MLALFQAGLRRAWGIGRPARSRVVPWALFGSALIPAIIVLGIAVLVSEDFVPSGYESYFGWIARILILFSAAVAPELVCPDQRLRVLSLYFSRPIGRLDYVGAKLGALLTAVLTLALVPEAILFLGHAFASQDTLDYVRDNLDKPPRIIGAGLLVGLYFGSIALAIAAHTTRRVFAAGGFIGLMLISTTVASVTDATLDNEPARLLGLLALSEVPIAATAWFFDVEPSPAIAQSVDFPAGLWVLVALAYTAVALLLLAWRYIRLTP